MTRLGHGTITSGGPCVQVGAALLPLPNTRQTVREWMAGVTAWPDLCPECGGEVCDCVTDEEMAALLARLDADPHGMNDLDGIEISF